MSATCSSIMIAEPTILHPKMTLKEVFPIIRHVGTRFLPVVDDAGDFLGTFSSMTLIKLLLPSSVSIKEGKNPFDLMFMQTTLAELSERLEEIGDLPITEHIFTDDVPTCTPQTSIMEALNLLYHYHYHVVVLAPDSRQFLGVITIKGVLDSINASFASEE